MSPINKENWEKLKKLVDKFFKEFPTDTLEFYDSNYLRTYLKLN